MTITNVLREAISDQNYVNSSLAEAAGLSHPVIGHFLKGKSRLNGESIDKLADYLGMELVQRINWSEYVTEMREDGTLFNEWAEYRDNALKAYTDEAWAEYVTDAWSEALASGDWQEDEYDEWVEAEYEDWCRTGTEHEERVMAEYNGWERQYLAECRAELESRDYVILTDR